jgi:hypothetical protein
MASKTDKCMKKLTKCDVWCIKAGTAAFILFLITVWPAAMALVHSIHWGWFLAATIIFMWKPFMKYMKA